jgi:hypothetical protein
MAGAIGMTGLMAATLTSAPVQADERIEKPAYWLSRGYVPVAFAAPSRTGEIAPWLAHSLPWPAEFENAAASVGNSMAEFQWYDDDGPYFHGGCDVRVARAAPVVAPVGGRVEAGHYGYSNNPDGSMEKFWDAWPKPGSRVYFEIAVVTDEGYRFEFHHMDESKMSPEVLAILREGKGGRVKAGTLLGATIPWPSGVYHHTHYNIISPSGVRLNPEHYSAVIADLSKPQVETVIAAFGGAGGTVSGKTKDFGDGHFDSAPNFFAVAVNDRTDGGKYVHPPVFAELRFAGGEHFTWDFRERLEGPDGKFPPIWQFFVESIRSPGGQSYRTAGGFGDGLSVIRLPVPKGASGPFTISVADDAGNAVSFAGEIAR